MTISPETQKLIDASNEAYRAYREEADCYEVARAAWANVQNVSNASYHALLEADTDTALLKAGREYQRTYGIQNAAEEARRAHKRETQVALFQLYSRAFAVASHALAEDTGLIWKGGLHYGDDFARPTGLVLTTKVDGVIKSTRTVGGGES